MKVSRSQFIEFMKNKKLLNQQQPTYYGSGVNGCCIYNFKCGCTAWKSWGLKKPQNLAFLVGDYWEEYDIFPCETHTLAE